MSTYNNKPLLSIPTTDVSSSETISVGTRQWADGKEYVYVKYAGGVTGVAEDVVGFSSAGDYTVELYSSGQGVKPAGTLVSTIANNQYGWAQVKGFGRVKSAANVVLSGMNVAGSVTGAADGVTGSNVSQAFGYYYDTATIPAGATGMNIYMDC